MATSQKSAPVSGGSTPPAVPHMTPDEFRRRGKAMVDWIADYIERLTGPEDQRPPVMARVEPGDVFRSLPEHPPERGEAWEEIAADIDRLVMPGVTHWQSPGFFGYFPANTCFPALLGDMLSSGLGVQGFLWATCPALTEVEMRITEWLAQLIGLPASFTIEGSANQGGGVIQSTASDATLVAMLAARERAPAIGAPAEGANGARLVAYASTQAHSSVVKAAMISGIGRENVRLIETDDELAMDAGELARQVRVDREAGNVPFFVCSTVGTTSTGAIDPVRAVGEIAQREAMWHHIDAAYAGSALVCPEFRWMVDGWESADTFNFNPHKWLMTNFDCSVLWTRDRASITGALSITPEYLRNRASETGLVIDYRDWQAPLGRRFRALKLWFVIRHYGAEGLRAFIREQVRLASVFEDLVRADGRFELIGRRELGLVCFRVRDGNGGDERSEALLEACNATGRVLLTHTVVPVGPARRERFVIRVSIGSTYVTEGDVRSGWDVIAASL